MCSIFSVTALFVLHSRRVCESFCPASNPSCALPKNCHISSTRLGDTQPQSDLFWPISWVNLIGGLWSIFNSLYRRCQSSPAQLCPIHLASFCCWLTVFWKAFLEVSLANAWALEECAFPPRGSEIPSAHFSHTCTLIFLLFFASPGMFEGIWPREWSVIFEFWLEEWSRNPASSFQLWRNLDKCEFLWTPRFESAPLQYYMHQINSIDAQSHTAFLIWVCETIWDFSKNTMHPADETLFMKCCVLLYISARLPHKFTWK